MKKNIGLRFKDVLFEYLTKKLQNWQHPNNRSSSISLTRVTGLFITFCGTNVVLSMTPKYSYNKDRQTMAHSTTAITVSLRILHFFKGSGHFISSAILGQAVGQADEPDSTSSVIVSQRFVSQSCARCVEKIDVIFHASVLLLITNFHITLSI